MERFAPAKLNLTLDVLGKRPDGYHDLKMVMQSITLGDTLTLEPGGEGVRVQTDLHFLPTGPKNLAAAAALRFYETLGRPVPGLKISIRKRIPVCAGMAGGSSDAASVLYGMNKMFSLGLSQDELMRRGVKIGADVPYCIMRGTALAEGIAEILTPLPPMPACFVLVAKPGISVSTKFVYENLHANDLRPEQHPDIDAAIAGIRAGDLKATAQAMGNVLELVTAREYPVIEEIKNFMKKRGALNAMMSGSGPTVFGLFENKTTARNAFYQLRRTNLAKQVYLTEIYNNRRQRV